MALPDTALDRLKAAFVSTNSGEADGAPALRVRTVGAVPISGALTVTSAGSSALAVGANGATNPVLQVDASVTSVATGLSVTGAAAGGGVALAAISSGAAEALSLAAKGAAALTLLTNSATRLTIASTGAITIAAPDSGVALTVPSIVGGTGTTSTLTLQSTSGVGAVGADIIFKVGNNGATEAMRILNSGDVGVATTTPALLGDGTARYFSIYNSSGRANLNLINAQADAAGLGIGNVEWVFASNATNYKRVASIIGSTEGITATQRGGVLTFYTQPNGVAGVSARLTIASTGAVTIAAPDSGVGLTVSGGGGNFTGGLTVATGNFAVSLGTISSTVTSGDNPATIFANDIAGAAALVVKAGDGTTSSNAAYVSSQINATVAQRWDFGCVSSTSWSVKDVTRNASPLTINLTGSITIAAPSSGVGLTISGGGLSVTGDLTIGDANNLVLNATTGTKIGTATSQKLAFYNSTPVVQPVGAGQAAVITTAATQTTPWGYATQAQADAIVTLVNQLRADLVALGLIKGAA